MFDMYAVIDNRFQHVRRASREFICEYTGMFPEDFNEAIADRGFVEFEQYRFLCALVVPAGTPIPEAAFV